MIVSMYPYIILDGQGQEAVKFYEHALDAEVIGLQTFGDMPGDPEFPTPPEAKDRVLNAHLKAGNAELMISDTFPGQTYQVGTHVSVAVSINNAEKAKEMFEKLQEGGQVTMPLQETFWSPAYGQVTDRYGVTWQVSTQKS
ncbi:VOC family protein [Desertibacillus haloalkaliphilus]|uniref:VOC family protein n=1 Tax=Desertibacillus haloalkaliphilus TaxID=1328930 RepID=UPI001C26A0A4|nr:VOC family protein [Desertibacillus haloalkaliphilus]MBU8906177.1 VOC family protein [Desertibacillus haloalkaliphilus]